MRLTALFLLLLCIVSGCETAPAASRAAPPAPPQPTTRPAPTPTSAPAWSVEVAAFGPIERFSKASPLNRQGRVVLAEIRITNRGTVTASADRTDFALLAPDGRRFSAIDFFAVGDPGPPLHQAIQPGLSSAHRLVFDVDPSLVGFTLVGLGQAVPVRL